MPKATEPQPLAQGPAEKLMAAVVPERVVSLTQRLVRISSQYSPDPSVDIREHHAVCAFLESMYRSMEGVEVQVAEPRDGFPVVVARLRGEKSRPALGFLGHYNTRPVGERSAWHVDPLGAEIRDGRIWGRGSGDMKKAIAAAVEAMRVARDSGVTLGDIVHVWFAGEGAHDSALEWLAGPGREAGRANWYVDTDGGPKIAKTSAPLVWIQLETEGVAGHAGVYLADGSKPVNAVTKMVKLLASIEHVDAWMSYSLHPLYGDPWRTSTKPFVEIYTVAGGMLGHVPEKCTALVEFYLLPGQTPDGVLLELQHLIQRLRTEDPDFLPVKVDVIQTFHNRTPWELREDHPVVQALVAVATPILGHPPEFIGAESGVRPALREVAEIITFGVPGGDKAHAPNESTSVAGLIAGARIYAGLIGTLLC